MKTKIGKYDPDTVTVAVTFTHAGVTHRRPVNAVLGEDGEYDAKGTADRIEEVARGVEHKIMLGVIS